MILFSAGETMSARLPEVTVLDWDAAAPLRIAFAKRWAEAFRSGLEASGARNFHQLHLIGDDGQMHRYHGPRRKSGDDDG
jgi:hypothetical protein